MYREFDMSYMRPAAAGRTTATTRGSGSSRVTAPAASTPTSTQPSHGVVCDGHRAPAIKLECRNGANRGRFFFKCNQPEGLKCRFYKWDDSTSPAAPAQSPGSNTRDAGGSGSGPVGNGGAAAGRSAGSFSGSGQTLGGGIASAGSIISRSTAAAAAGAAAPSPPQRHSQTSSSSSSTEYTQSDAGLGSPSKRRRTEWGSAPNAAAGASTSAAINSSNKPTIRTQTAEEAIDEDWDEDIDDIEDFEAGGSGQASAQRSTDSSPTKGKGKAVEKFTSFGGSSGQPTTPRQDHSGNGANNRDSALMRTPPRGVHQGLPVTPVSVGASRSSMSTAAGANVTSNGNGNGNAAPPLNPWEQIRSDPSSPFYGRAAALVGNGSPSVRNNNNNNSASDLRSLISSTGTSDLLLPQTPSPVKVDPTSPVLGSGSGRASDMATPAHSGIFATTTEGQLDTPTSQLRSLSGSFASMTAAMSASLESASRSANTLERQLRAAQQKATFHEKREREAKAELEELRKKVAALQRENEELRTGLL